MMLMTINTAKVARSGIRGNNVPWVVADNSVAACGFDSDGRVQ